MNENVNYISEFHKNLDHTKIILAYNGKLSKDIIESFLTRLLLDVERLEISKRDQKRLYSIAVEAIQNLSKHGKVSDSNNSHFLLIIEREKNLFKVSTGNVIPKSQEKTIEALIDRVNGMDSEMLQNIYLDGLSKNKLSIDGEAKLGLIDIARKSNEKLIFQFNEIDNSNSFFVFQTQVRVS